MNRNRKTGTAFWFASADRHYRIAAMIPIEQTPLNCVPKRIERRHFITLTASTSPGIVPNFSSREVVLS
jgi:hypothetical protein